jgi:predicted ATPase
MSKEKLQHFPPTISRIEVSGFKSLNDSCSIEIAPLTVLAGANSSGKSSIMQPLLLLKQTLEATYDPGALLLDGPNARFSSTEQLLSKISGKQKSDKFSVYIETQNNPSLKTRAGLLKLTFKKSRSRGLEIDEMLVNVGEESFLLRPNMTNAEILSVLPENLKMLSSIFAKAEQKEKNEQQWQIGRNRCFLELKLEIGQRGIQSGAAPGGAFEPLIRGVIHVPGLRGNPARTYKTTAVGSEFPGTFENYAASVIYHWQTKKDKNLENIGHALETLGLGWRVIARSVDDTNVELRVGRMPHGNKNDIADMVSIADVGFGVSQTLPILVALFVANPGQLVYLEQPEIHLHPRAQFAFAKLLADAANRGVRVVTETHSSLILLGIQSLVAENYITYDKLRLHWFARNNDGTTKINSTQVDEAGAFGDWPEDFGEVALEAESKYLDAAEARQVHR